MSGTARLTGEP